MRRSKVTRRFLFLTLIVICLVLAVPGPTPANESVKLGIFVHENLEGYHTPSSTFGTYLGSELLPVFKNLKVEHAVPLQTNETVRILDELTEERKVVWTTLQAVATNGAIEYPSVTFADDTIKFRDLTWKVDEARVAELAKKAGLTHCLVGTCTGYAASTDAKSVVGSRGLTPVTASVNVHLLNLKTDKTEWMKNYRQVVPHSDPRIAFEQAVEMIAEKIAGDLNAFFKDTYGVGN